MNAVYSIVERQIPNVAATHPNYAAALRQACEEVDPPFGQGWYGEKFRECATDLQWILNQTVINAVREADGARFLWSLSDRVSEPYAEMVRQHAIDESHHARFYLSAIELAFPHALTSDFIRNLHRSFPVFNRESAAAEPSPNKPLEAYLDDVVQTSFAEIRTLINQLLMKPVLMAICPEANQARLDRLLSTLSGDEVRHIVYTADVIEALGKPELTPQLMIRRLHDFSEVTLREVGSQASFQ